MGKKERVRTISLQAHEGDDFDALVRAGEASRISTAAMFRWVCSALKECVIHGASDAHAEFALRKRVAQVIMRTSLVRLDRLVTPQELSAACAAVGEVSLSVAASRMESPMERAMIMALARKGLVEQCRG